MEIITAISVGIISFIGAFIGSKLASKGIKWDVRYDEAQKKFTIEKTQMKPGKVYFIPDATEEELEENNKESKLKKFLGGIKKSFNEEDI